MIDDIIIETIPDAARAYLREIKDQNLNQKKRKNLSLKKLEAHNTPGSSEKINTAPHFRVKKRLRLRS